MVQLSRWCFGCCLNLCRALRTATYRLFYGRDGKLQVDGLGGSYGVERLSHYQMRPEMGPPETTIWEYPGEDMSFKLELSSFVDSITGGVRRGPGLGDALKALEIVETIYRTSKR